MEGTRGPGGGWRGLEIEVKDGGNYRSRWKVEGPRGRTRGPGGGWRELEVQVEGTGD